LSDFLSALSTEAFETAVAGADVRHLSPHVANILAAMVETMAVRLGAVAPPWTKAIKPLAEPYFASDLKALTAHLLMNSPPAYRRRNLFVDSTLGDRV